MHNDQKKRVILIGIDGAPCRLIKDLAENGVMPNVKRLIDKGFFSMMQSTIPEISSIAWSSIITGKNAAEHGIFGFTDFPLGTYRLSFPNFNNLQAEPFWKKYDQERSIIINVPSTYPAREMNGILVSGFVALDMERAVYPSTFISKLNELNYEIDVDSSLAHKSLDLFLNNLDKVLDARIALFHYLWENEDWQNFMFVFTGSDRLFHFLWEAYEQKDHKYHHIYKEHFSKIDGVVGKILDTMHEDDLLIMLSDHGFESMGINVNVNYVLRDKGYLKLKDKPQITFSDIDYGTKAFALDPSRIYINLEGKYPCGSVSSADFQKVKEEIKDIFYSLEVEGKKVIKKIFEKDEIFHGPLLEQAPDLVLLSNTGMNLKANITAGALTERNIFTGKHTQEDAFFLMNKHSLKNLIDKDFSVADVMKVVDAFKGGK